MRILPASVDALVIGGGFYGSRLATFLAKRFRDVALIEREAGILKRASFVNQARVHGGYHYPRSILTSVRSRRNYLRFVTDYAPAIVGGFDKLYVVARRQSRTSASQFEQFCRRIGAPISRAPKRLTARFDPALVEGVFLVEECAFDAVKLAACVSADLVSSGVAHLTSIEAMAVSPGRSRRLRVEWRSGDMHGHVESDWVVLATYAALNEVLRRSGLPSIPLIHELTEVIVIDVPPSMCGLGVTVMDGPFWSTMPFPPFHGHSLTHVRYTPHARWESGSGTIEHTPDAILRLHQCESHREAMRRDAARYFPEIGLARIRMSLWEVKTLLPRSEVDDSRPILVRRVDEAPGLLAVLGAKIDSVYDVEAALPEILAEDAP